MDIRLDEIKTFCVNLDQRPDRWAEVVEEVKKLDIEMERFAGIKHSRGHTGCILSHMVLWSREKHRGIFMIIEDDILLLENAKENLERAISQLPEDWDALYLGATLNETPERVSENLVRLKRGWTCHAIIWNNQHGIIDFLEDNMNLYKIDVVMANDVQPKFNCYMCYPMVASQRPGYSNIVRHDTDYAVIMKRYKKYVQDVFE